MPSRSQHLTKAQHKEALFDQLQPMAPGFHDWQATALFYAALHYVDAVLDDSSGLHPSDHAAREGYITRVASLKPIWPQYRELRDRSIDARYRSVTFPAQLILTLKSVNFQQLRDSLRRTLGLLD